jgi:DNA mismatch endonuclease (patch repair protein)
MDVHSKTSRSYNMSRIRSSKTQPELKMKKVLRTLGFTYQPKGIYGKPDFADRNDRIAIFIDGCYWHKCPKHYTDSKSNRSYWLPKIKRNVARDKEVSRQLRSQGWIVIRIWEHSIAKL